MTPTLAHTKRYFGFGDEDDHVVLDDGRLSDAYFSSRRRHKVARGSGQSLHASTRHQFTVAVIQRHASRQWRILKSSGYARCVQKMPGTNARAARLFEWLAENFLLERVVMGRDARRNYVVSLQHISDALIDSGYTKLDEQAKALGVKRSTAWTIIKTKHKLGRLSNKTTRRILANPHTPSAVRSVVQKYLAERSDVLAFRTERLNRREQQSNKLRAVRN
jgi:hypothetical protein